MRVPSLVLLACLGVVAAGRGGGFEPLDRWKAAVLAGDRFSLHNLYAQGEQGTAEAAFWSQLAAQGLTGINPKILERLTPAPDQVKLVLRIEMTFRPGSPLESALVSARQVWARRGADWSLVQTQRSDLRPLPVIRLPQPEVPNTNLYPEPAKAKAELAAALSAAKGDHKRVLVIFGATWCYDCHVLDTTLRSREVAPLVRANYHVLHINVGEDDSNNEMAERYQVPLNKGIPALAVLDADGKVVTASKNGEFESAAKIGMKDVTGFLERWKPGAAN